MRENGAATGLVADLWHGEQSRSPLEDKNMVKTLDTFTEAYITCALWSSTDEDGESLDGLYTVDDISPETLAQIQEDCAAFQADHADDIGDELVQAGHDFWLTRNRHGAGFWDRGEGYYPTGAGSRLTDAAHVYGSVDLYVGDDGLIYGS